MTVITLVYLAVAILLSIAILMQAQGGGLGSTFGGSQSFHTKRGIEKSLFYVTIALASLFTILSIAVLL